MGMPLRKIRKVVAADSRQRSENVFVNELFFRGRAVNINGFYGFNLIAKLQSFLRIKFLDRNEYTKAIIRPTPLLL